jgi:hypothetical protein
MMMKELPDLQEILVVLRSWLFWFITFLVASLLVAVAATNSDVVGSVDVLNQVEYIAVAAHRNWTFDNITDVTDHHDLKSGFVSCLVRSSDLVPIDNSIRVQLVAVYRPGHSIELGNRAVLGPSSFFVLYNKNREGVAALAVFSDPAIALMQLYTVDRDIGIYQIIANNSNAGLFQSKIILNYLDQISKKSRRQP